MESIKLPNEAKYVYPFYAGERIPDVMEVVLKDGEVVITCGLVDGVFTEWISKTPDFSSLELRLLEPREVVIVRFDSASFAVTGVRSVNGDFGELDVTFRQL